MHIQHVEISNFRKLQSVRIDFSTETTVFVGANNSGKTSAMVALRLFLLRGEFSLNDFTLAHWARLDAEAATWGAANAQTPEPFEWGQVLPTLDIWLNVPTNELHYVQKLLPSLDWTGASVGVRLRFEPKDIELLKRDYLAAKAAADAVTSATQNSSGVATADAAAPATVTATSQGFALWPRTFTDYLSRRLRNTFQVRAYLLDPAKVTAPDGGIAKPQAVPPGSEPMDDNPLADLIRIDEISAQRGFGFSDSSRNDDEASGASDRPGKRLSSQLRTYYARHLDPLDKPEPSDLEALRAMHAAQSTFGERLRASFQPALTELETIGYPGVTDPKLTVTPQLKPIDGLSHASAVQYEIQAHRAVGDSGETNTCRLPEDSNGLGYQNLVSIVFALMSFRDRWMRVGKAVQATTIAGPIAPLHLVLIEEPEAHLHAQVQQVFIRQAYDVLRKHDNLGASPDFRTQLVISTHSSHLAHEADFGSLRYFRRLPAPKVSGAVPISSVINLSTFFGNEDNTRRFVRRYLKATHCDLFFADGAVLVEGPAERILVPHFVRERSAYDYLKRCYITWLEIGGSHAHRLKELLEHLGLTTLIITDIDAMAATGTSSVVPKRGHNLRSRNHTLKTWVPREESLDALLDKQSSDLVSEGADGATIRVAYQQPVKIAFKGTMDVEALANTFEDTLLYENIDAFATISGAGLFGAFKAAVDSSANVDVLANAAKEALAGGDKAEFALTLLLGNELQNMRVPAYIDAGLTWLAQQLKRREDALGGSSMVTVSTTTVPDGTSLPTSAPEAVAASQGQASPIEP
jgi:predicted ATP-dependent endonuclease of OLD family